MTGTCTEKEACINMIYYWKEPYEHCKEMVFNEAGIVEC